MSSRKSYIPHIMRIDSTLGECGNNKPEEVLWFQQTLSVNRHGFNRHLRVI